MGLASGVPGRGRMGAVAVIALLSLWPSAVLPTVVLLGKKSSEDGCRSLRQSRLPLDVVLVLLLFRRCGCTAVVVVW